MWKRLLVGFVFAALVVAIGALYYRETSVQPASTTIPSPNAYETLARAGSLADPLPLDFDTSQDVEVLGAYVQRQSESLELIRQAAEQDSRVPISRIESDQAFYDSIGDVQTALRLLNTRARIAELEQRYADAIEDFLLIAELSDKVSAGGVLVNQMSAAAYWRHALDGLGRNASNLSDDQRRRVDSLLEAGRGFTVDTEELIDRERLFMRRTRGLIASMLADTVLESEIAIHVEKANAEREQAIVSLEQNLETLGQ